MGWRVLQITKACKLSLKNHQLICDLGDKEKLVFPIEDLLAIVIEDLRVVITAYLIAELMDANVVIYTCDKKHMPSGIVLPFHNHSRYYQISWLQISISEPLKKRLWQQIVKAKILNQASVLRYVDIEASDKLVNISKEVKSGDSGNAEALAAKLYWSNLFNKFKREDDSDIRNIALNYGYAILRGAISRAIVASGLLPCFGLHHCNQLNAYNLSDDLIEPFRPFFDYIVLNYNFEEHIELTPKIKNDFLNILNNTCIMNNERHQIYSSIEIMCNTLVTCIKEKNTSSLILPKFSLEEREYSYV